MKKIGLLCLALVIALGSLGIGYAAWTDTLTIDGTVNTGDVDINAVRYSGTYVFKDLSNDGIVIDHRWGPGIQLPHWLLVASAQAQRVRGQDDQVRITYTNLFPSIDFVADILLHYEGSIPVKINTATFTVDPATTDPELLALWAAGKQADGTGAWIDWYWSNAAGEKIGDPITDPHGIQLHESNYILVEGHIHLPQNNALMGKSGSFTATLEVVQWNKYPYTHPS